MVQFRRGHTAMTQETIKCEAIDRSTPGCSFFREHNLPASINNPARPNAVYRGWRLFWRPLHVGQLLRELGGIDWIKW
jgi:hypothetical protein